MAITRLNHRDPTPPTLPAPCTVADTLDALRIATRDGTDRCVAIACLDRDRRPLGMFIVDDCDCGPEEVSFVVDFLLDAVRATDTVLDAVVLASSRPGEDPSPDEFGLWPRLVVRGAVAGVTLLEWYVLDAGGVRAIGNPG